MTLYIDRQNLAVYKSNGTVVIRVGGTGRGRRPGRICVTPDCAFTVARGVLHCIQDETYAGSLPEANATIERRGLYVLFSLGSELPYRTVRCVALDGERASEFMKALVDAAQVARQGSKPQAA